jgi:protein-S-isoprenylcysteine O-methyltransferase Ste14
MDLLLLALQITFMGPMLVRVLTRERPGTTIDRELAATFRTPGLLVHIIGLLLVWIGFDLRFSTGTVDRAITWPGAIGAAVLIIANVVMFSGFASLRSWRLLPTIEGGHELCTTGPYRLVRHPIYLAFDLLGLGVAIAVPSSTIIAGAILLIIGGDLRGRAEERALVTAFGAQYEDYMRRVARRIPGVY